jgi:hypothetical protein
MNERDGMYGGIPEITAFVEILAKHEINLQIRIWRECDGNLALSTSIQPPTSATRLIVADLHHSGEMTRTWPTCAYCRGARLFIHLLHPVNAVLLVSAIQTTRRSE